MWGRVIKTSFSDVQFWASFTGNFEIVSGIILIIGFLTRIAVLPLIIIMFTAFVTTKLSILNDKGFWVFANEYRTDFAMTLLLFYLFYYGSGNYSIDKKIYDRSKK